MDRPALAEFLRSRREVLRPADVGLGEGPRRRTPGLRREEVAQLAGMSVDYYTRLEQQRGPQPSEQMVQAIARALRLTLDERDHLFHLAGQNAPARVHRSDHVAPALLRVLDRLEDTPALVVSDLGETLVANSLAAALFGDASGFSGPARFQIWRWYHDPAEKARYAPEEHEHLERTQVATLRAALGAAGTGDTRAQSLLAALLSSSPAFVATWARQEVATRWSDTKTLVHPSLGRIAVDCQVLLTENRAQALLLFTATPGSADADKLELLRVVGVQAF